MVPLWIHCGIPGCLQHSLEISNLIAGYSNFDHEPSASALSRNLFLPLQTHWIKMCILTRCLRDFFACNSSKSSYEPLFITWSYPTIVRCLLLLYIFKFLLYYLIFSAQPSQVDSEVDRRQRCYHVLWFLPAPTFSTALDKGLKYLMNKWTQSLDLPEVLGRVTCARKSLTKPDDKDTNNILGKFRMNVAYLGSWAWYVSFFF